MTPVRRDPFGFEQVIHHPASGLHAASIRALRRLAALPAGDIDRTAVAGYLAGHRLSGRTILEDFRSVPPGQALSPTSDDPRATPEPAVGAPGGLEARLVGSLEGVVASGRRAAIALSGGLDSALLLALLARMGAAQVPAYVLATRLPDYDELDAALATARRHGAEVTVVEVTAGDFVEALPVAMRHLEEPLYNLHPLAKLLLARAMRRDGIDVALSGDGADQVLRRDTSADYLPLCRTLFEATGVQLVPPFLDGAVVDHLLSTPPDADKQCLRALGRRLGVAPELTEGPKRSRLAPALDLAPLLPAEGLARLAAQLGTNVPELRTDAQRVHWASLLLLLTDLGVAD
jgi:hypothetical protein